MARAVSSPRSPSPTFELPELATTARRRSSRASLRHDHGRAHARVRGEARGGDRVGLVRDEHAHVEPLRLDAGGHAGGAGSPAGSAVGSSSVTCAGRSTQRERKKVTRRPSVSRQPEHQVEVLHGLPGGALPEVVDRRQRPPGRSPARPSRGCGSGWSRARRARRAARRRAPRTARPRRRPGTGRGPASGVEPRWRHVAAREQALVDRQQVRGEREARAEPAAPARAPRGGGGPRPCRRSRSRSTDTKWVVSVASRPAPDTPDLASTIASPMASRSGHSASRAAVG